MQAANWLMSNSSLYNDEGIVNFATKRAIPHIHYTRLSRVTTIEGLHIANLCEDKIAVSTDL